MLVNSNPSIATPVKDDCLTFHQDRIALVGGDFRPNVMRQYRQFAEQLDALV
jgi:hypothetical protein